MHLTNALPFGFGFQVHAPAGCAPHLLFLSSLKEKEDAPRPVEKKKKEVRPQNAGGADRKVTAPCSVRVYTLRDGLPLPLRRCVRKVPPLDYRPRSGSGRLSRSVSLTEESSTAITHVLLRPRSAGKRPFFCRFSFCAKKEKREKAAPIAATGNDAPPILFFSLAKREEKNAPRPV